LIGAKLTEALLQMATALRSQIQSPSIGLVAAKDAVSRVLLCRLLREIGIADLTEVDSTGHAMLQLQHGLKGFDLILCDTLEGDGHLRILKFVRWQTTLPLCNTTPVICVADHWSGEQLAAIRDAGVSAVLTAPLTKRAMQVAIASATSMSKCFIDSPAFRGFDRRISSMKGYMGPYRRAADGHLRSSSPLAASTIKGPQPSSREHPRSAVSPSAATATCRIDRILWAAGPETGIPDIDTDHRLIGEALERVGKSVSRNDPAEAVSLKIGALRDRLARHFAREETIMATFGYVRLAEHTTAHEEFTARVGQLVRELDGQGRLPEISALADAASWLNNHITIDDADYVREMLYGDKDKAESVTVRQASIVLHGAFELVGVVDDLRARIKSTADVHAVRPLRRRLYDATEKLANLLMLVPEGSTVWASLGGGLQHQFTRVRESFFGAAADLASARIDRIIAEAEAVLADHGAVPFGISAKLSRRWASVEAMGTIMGGASVMADDLRLKFFQGRELLQRIAELEDVRCKLPNFGAGDKGTGDAGLAKADHQADVIGRLATVKGS